MDLSEKYIMQETEKYGLHTKFPPATTLLVRIVTVQSIDTWDPSFAVTSRLIVSILSEHWWVINLSGQPHFG